jgi:SAM-dependent methyltransferase
MDSQWTEGGAYERYMGVWSSGVARAFVDWLARPPGLRWLDLGCGTGALTEAIVQRASPASVLGIDTSSGFIAHARERLRVAGSDSRLHFEVGDAQAPVIVPRSVDAAVCGLLLNFLPAPQRALAAMGAALRPGGMAAAYVWDYAAGMPLLQHFWQAAADVDPSAAALDEARRFAGCAPQALLALFRAAGLQQVELRAIEVERRFAGFDDCWSPFTGGQGPAPHYAMSLAEPQRAALREALRRRLPMAADGSLRLAARAWALHGRAA